MEVLYENLISNKKLETFSIKAFPYMNFLRALPNDTFLEILHTSRKSQIVCFLVVPVLDKVAC